jgi:hypothetical protein
VRGTGFGVLHCRCDGEMGCDQTKVSLDLVQRSLSAQRVVLNNIRDGACRLEYCESMVDRAFGAELLPKGRLNMINTRMWSLPR